MAAPMKKVPKHLNFQYIQGIDPIKKKRHNMLRKGCKNVKNVVYLKYIMLFL